jgi:hypothetical protein
MKRLKLARFQVESHGPQAFLMVKFLDDTGQMYSWSPRWDDAEQLFLRAIILESAGKAEGVGQPIQVAYKAAGTLGAFVDGEVVFYAPSEDIKLTPRFPVIFEFLDIWLDKRVEVLVINGVAAQVQDEWSGETYPKPRSNDRD